MKIYNGFCRDVSEASTLSSESCIFFKQNDSQRASDTIRSLCKSNNTKVLKLTLAKSDIILSDEDFFCVLKYIARLESDEIAPQLLERLTRKHFTLFTLRPHLMKFQPDEVARIVQAGINLLAKSTTNIDHCVELLLILIDCHWRKLLWSAEFAAQILQNIEFLNTMISLCSEFTRTETMLRTSLKMPVLRKPPHSECVIKRIQFERREFDLNESAK